MATIPIINKKDFQDQTAYKGTRFHRRAEILRNIDSMLDEIHGEKKSRFYGLFAKKENKKGALTLEQKLGMLNDLVNSAKVMVDTEKLTNKDAINSLGIQIKREMNRTSTNKTTAQVNARGAHK